MQTVVVSDIFGRTKALERLCARLAGEYEIIDPYAGKEMRFDDEARAYEYFMETIGLNGYAERLQGYLAGCKKEIVIIGFSVGASAIWRISESLDEKRVKKVVGFYGSQIRHGLTIEPSVEVDLYLPASEPTFSVADLADRLTEKSKVRIHRTPYLHGFMNELSVNFNREGYLDYIDLLKVSWNGAGPS